MSARLHIERVVLHGVDLGPGQRQRFHAELERQLGALLLAQPPAPRAFAHDTATAAPVTLGRATPAEDSARAVATSLHGCLRP
jgi:hypothetical protein